MLTQAQIKQLKEAGDLNEITIPEFLKTTYQTSRDYISNFFEKSLGFRPNINDCKKATFWALNQLVKSESWDSLINYSEVTFSGMEHMSDIVKYRRMPRHQLGKIDDTIAKYVFSTIGG